MTSTGAFPAVLFDGKSLYAHPVFLEVSGTTARLVADERSEDFALADLRVSPRVANAQRFVVLPNGAELVCPDDPSLDLIPASSRSEGVVAWLEQRVWVALVSVVATMAGFAGFYVFVLPLVADGIARRISPERERTLGQYTLGLFDRQLMRPTQLDPGTAAQLHAGFDELTKQLPGDQPVRLELRSALAIGPNAFALPGGVVVVTDQLVELCSTDETIAVLAHEVGHVSHRHALRHMIQEVGVTALGGLLTSDAASTSLAATTVPIALAQAQYSQAFESEADAAGFQLLRVAGWSPELFASCLSKISEKDGRDDRGIGSYVSSHPSSQDRIDRAHQAALGFKPWRGLSPGEPGERSAPSMAESADHGVADPEIVDPTGSSEPD